MLEGTSPFPLNHLVTTIQPTLVKIELSPCDIAIYWHTPTDGSDSYLIIDIDNEADTDIEPLPLLIYRNDAPVYDERPTPQDPQEATP